MHCRAGLRKGKQKPSLTDMGLGRRCRIRLRILENFKMAEPQNQPSYPFDPPCRLLLTTEAEKSINRTSSGGYSKDFFFLTILPVHPLKQKSRLDDYVNIKIYFVPDSKMIIP